MAERSRTETHPASDSRLGLLPRRFQPQLTLGFQQDLSALTADLAELPSETQRQRLEEAIDVVDTSRIELSELGVLGSKLQPTVAYGVALRLLRDLLGQGWELALDDEGILLRPPIAAAGATDDPSTAKAILRQSFSFARKAQLAGARHEPGRRTTLRDEPRRPAHNPTTPPLRGSSGEARATVPTVMAQELGLRCSWRREAPPAAAWGRHCSDEDRRRCELPNQRRARLQPEARWGCLRQSPPRPRAAQEGPRIWTRTMIRRSDRRRARSQPSRRDTRQLRQLA